MNVPIHDKVVLTQALHPSADHYVDAGRYLGEFGADATGKRRARCPFCLKHAMELAIEGDPSSGFVHRGRTTASLCPIVTQSPQSLTLRITHARNVAWHQQHRAAFIADWQTHFRRMKAQVPSLSINRLTSLIAYADVVSLWSHPNLALSDIPYLLLALGELIADRSDRVSTYWMRFVFDGTVRSVDDLWTPRTVAPRLYRIRYRTDTVGKLPIWRDIVACDVVRYGAPDEGAAPGWLPIDDLKQFEAFAHSGDGLGFGDYPLPDEVMPAGADQQASDRESLENYAVYTMRAYARRRGR